MSKLEEIAYNPDQETEVVRDQVSEAYRIFCKTAYGNDGYPIMCQLHEIFGSETEPPAENRVADHNCLGCTFADSINLIANFLRQPASQTHISFSHTTCLFLFYLLVERMDTLLNLIKFNDEIRKVDFKILIELRKWANFIKHPKAFILVHHPVFTFEGAAQNVELKKQANVCLDYAFILKFYSNDEHNDELLAKLANQENVLVVYPSLPRVTTQICESMITLISTLRENEIFRRILKERSTFQGFWLPIPAEIPKLV